LYDSNPEYPSAKEITTVTGYVVGYACKENSTLGIERKKMKDFTLR
jgi:hypothetical protein